MFYLCLQHLLKLTIFIFLDLIKSQHLKIIFNANAENLSLHWTATVVKKLKQKSWKNLSFIQERLRNQLSRWKKIELRRFFCWRRCVKRRCKFRCYNFWAAEKKHIHIALYVKIKFTCEDDKLKAHHIYIYDDRSQTVVL